MKIEIKIIKDVLSTWKGVGYGLFIKDKLISAFTSGTEFETNIDAILKTGTDRLEVSMKPNYELSLKGDAEVFDLLLNTKHVSRFAKGSLVYKNIMEVFDLKEPTEKR